MVETGTHAAELARHIVGALVNGLSGRLVAVVLFGSRARGDARPDSDYDIAVFLRDGVNLLEESRALAELETDVLFDTGAIITTIPFPAGAYARPTPLMQEIRREGRDL